MFGQNLSVNVANRRLAWLMGVGILMAIRSLVIQTNLTPNLVADWPVEMMATAINLSLEEPHPRVPDSLGLEQEPNTQQFCYQLPAQFQGQTIYGVKLPLHRKAIALTFDDGPWPNTTPKVLDILQQHQVQATFFVLGSNVAQYPDLLQRVATAGHAVGNHSWSHRYQNYSSDLAQDEIQQTTDIIEKYTGFKTALFRPPGGYLNNGLVAQAEAQQMVTVLWTVDDTYHGSVETAVQNVLENATSGGIVLMHDGGGDRELTIKALPQIISALQQQGYQFVTIPQLLDMAATEDRPLTPMDCQYS